MSSDSGANICELNPLTDSGGEAHISTATRILAEIIASDVSLLVTFNQAIEVSSRIMRRQGPIPKL
jgi:hypothetical protein